MLRCFIWGHRWQVVHATADPPVFVHVSCSRCGRQEVREPVYHDARATPDLQWRDEKIEACEKRIGSLTAERDRLREEVAHLQELNTWQAQQLGFPPYNANGPRDVVHRCSCGQLLNVVPQGQCVVSCCCGIYYEFVDGALQVVRGRWARLFSPAMR